MNVSVAVDLATGDEVSPGFDEPSINKAGELAPSSARAKLLIDDKVGPVSRQKLLDLIQQYLDTLDYPVKIDTQIAHFPQPQGTEGKIALLRERVSKQFTNTLNDLLRQFCPQHCLLADTDIQTDVVNGEEAQYGAQGEFIQDGDTAIRVRDISATLLMDEAMSPEEQANILEMARLKTSSFKHVTLTPKSLRFPRPVLADQNNSGSAGRGLASDSKNSDTKSNSDSKTNLDSKTDTKQNSEATSNLESKTNSDSKTNSTNHLTESNTRQEKFERVEKIERVESGDAVQAELQKFKVFGLIFACSIIALLVFIAVAGFHHSNRSSPIQRVIQDLASDPASENDTPNPTPALDRETKSYSLSKRYEIERYLEDLTGIYAQQPRVAKQVFSRVLTEEGVEATAQCIHIFGEGIVIDMLRDPSLQTDVTELMEFYAKNPFEISDDEKLDLLRKLHNRTVAGKLVVLGNRSSNLFDFLSEMDGLQILELIRTESLTVKSIVLTQVDPQKRSAIYSQLDPEIRMKLLTELSRIDYLPRDFIFNVASALKRKKKENPRLNTEALPGSEVLVSLLERTGQAMQKVVVKSLESSNPDSARTVKSKLVSIETLRFLRDGQLLEVVLSLKHDELIQFLKGAPEEIRQAIFAKSPQELVIELEEELTLAPALSRETYQNVERKVLNRMKVMANEGQINLIETNERMFTEVTGETAYIQTAAKMSNPGNPPSNLPNFIKKVAGW
jgi:flagellar motor switch protein FliG